MATRPMGIWSCGSHCIPSIAENLSHKYTARLVSPFSSASSGIWSYVREFGDTAEVDVDKVEAMVAERSRLRHEGRWKESDAIRARLKDEHDVSVYDNGLVWFVGSGSGSKHGWHTRQRSLKAGFRKVDERRSHRIHYPERSQNRNGSERERYRADDFDLRSSDNDRVTQYGRRRNDDAYWTGHDRRSGDGYGRRQHGYDRRHHGYGRRGGGDYASRESACGEQRGDRSGDGSGDW